MYFFPLFGNEHDNQLRMLRSLFEALESIFHGTASFPPAIRWEMVPWNNRREMSHKYHSLFHLKKKNNFQEKNGLLVTSPSGGTCDNCRPRTSEPWLLSVVNFAIIRARFLRIRVKMLAETWITRIDWNHPSAGDDVLFLEEGGPTEGNFNYQRWHVIRFYSTGFSPPVDDSIARKFYELFSRRLNSPPVFFFFFYIQIRP